MKNRLITLCLLLGVLLFSQCTSEEKELQFYPPVFQDTIYPEVKVLNDTFMMNDALDLDYYKDYLIVNSNRNKQFIHLFNRTTGEHIKSMLSQGRGHGEVMLIIDMDIDPETGEVSCYDVATRKMNYFNIDTVAVHDNASDYIWGENLSFYVHRLLSGKHGMLGLGGSKDANGNPRFSLLKDGLPITQYYTFPAVKMPKIDKPSRSGIETAYGGSLSVVCLSPSGDKMVCLPMCGAILEIFNISPDTIQLNTIKGFHRPEFDLNEWGSMISIEGKTVRGFLDAYATEDYIYTIFLRDLKIGETENNQIAVFDWKGNCERLYQVVGYNLRKICVDQSQNRLYAAALNADGESSLIYFDL